MAFPISADIERDSAKFKFSERLAESTLMIQESIIYIHEVFSTYAFHTVIQSSIVAMVLVLVNQW